MKKTKKLCATLLSAVICAGTVSGVSANAIALIGEGIEPPAGYSIIDDRGFFDKEVNYRPGSNIPYVVYEKETTGGIILATNHVFNVTTLFVLNENDAEFSEIYENYADALDFDVVDKNDFNYKDYVVYTMYDNRNAEGNLSCDPTDYENKYSLILKMVNEMKTADVIFDATFKRYQWMGTAVGMGTSLCVGGLTAADAEELEALVTPYGAEITFYGDINAYGEYEMLLLEYGWMEADGHDLTDITARIEEAKEAMTNVSEEDAEYYLDNVFTLDTKLQLQELIEQRFENASVPISYSILETSDLTVTPEEIDLMTAEYVEDEESSTVETTDAATTDTTTEPTANPEDIQEAVEAILTYLYGDPDNDGKITIQDAYNTLLYYAKVSAGEENVAFTAAGDEAAEQAAFTAADVDKDGKITINDAYLILKYYATKSAGGTPSWDK